MILTYRYRLLPTKSQHHSLEALLESQRQLYNAALQERIEAYRKANVTRTYFDQTRALSEWRQDDPEASAVPLNLQRATLKRLDEAYRGFFRRVKSGGKPGFPRFRGKGWFDGFGFREFRGISLKENGLRFKGMPGTLRVHLHRPIPIMAAIKSCTFRRDAKGWYVGFAVDLPTPPMRDGDRAVGIDLGITTFAALSDGGAIPSLRAARRAARRLRRAQRALSRKNRGSNGRRKARTEVRRCHAATVRQRANHLHPRNTTQDCSGCGAKVPKALGDRQHDCPHCGLSIDRDLNAARNILNRAGVGPGLRNVAGCGMRAGGNLIGSANARLGRWTQTRHYPDG